jgi:hypothetical protein
MAVPKDEEEAPEYPMYPVEPIISVDSIHTKPPIGSSTPKRVVSETGMSAEEAVQKPMPTKRRKEKIEIRDEKKTVEQSK